MADYVQNGKMEQRIISLIEGVAELKVDIKNVNNKIEYLSKQSDNLKEEVAQLYSEIKILKKMFSILSIIIMVIVQMILGGKIAAILMKAITP